MKYIKLFEAFEESFQPDDINVNITSTVVDILQDHIDDGLLDIECFTVGYKTLRDAGATHTDNSISLFILPHYHEHIEYKKNKTLDMESLIPYLKRVVEYVESEGRKVVISLQYRNYYKVPASSYDDIGMQLTPSVKEINLDRVEDIPDTHEYESIVMSFSKKETSK